MRTAVITGGSRGLGRATARALADRRWRLILDARGADDLVAVADELSARTDVVVVPGDISDDEHRRALIDAAGGGRLDLLVNNASLLGPSPQPRLAEYDLQTLARVYDVNVFGPLRLTQLALPLLRASAGHVLNVTSDAAVEGYEGWGGYGSSKAALEQWSRVLAAEEPAVRVWWVDPGDMNTRMHQEAFPGEDISDRPPPEAVVPALLELIDRDPPSGRYQAADLVPKEVVPS
ncbi:MAG: SDR family oxidoreductase [Acidimicrobiia bacterium]|nr:SDR family oxidoreductase [Acidimicrobiia bacterium]